MGGSGSQAGGGEGDDDSPLCATAAIINNGRAVMYGWQLVWRFADPRAFSAGDVRGAVLVTGGDGSPWSAVFVNGQRCVQLPSSSLGLPGCGLPYSQLAADPAAADPVLDPAGMDPGESAINTSTRPSFPPQAMAPPPPPSDLACASVFCCGDLDGGGEPEAASGTGGSSTYGSGISSGSAGGGGPATAETAPPPPPAPDAITALSTALTQLTRMEIAQQGGFNAYDSKSLSNPGGGGGLTVNTTVNASSGSSGATNLTAATLTATTVMGTWHKAKRVDSGGRPQPPQSHMAGGGALVAESRGPPVLLPSQGSLGQYGFGGGNGGVGGGGVLAAAAPTPHGLPAAAASWVAIDFARDVVLQRRLGSGAHGTVYQGLWVGRPVAVKVLSRLSHPHIVQFFGACLAPPHVCIVEELAAAGSLHHRLHARRRGSSVKLHPAMSYGESTTPRLGYFANSSPACDLLDLKPQNVLLDGSGRAKVCDFGIAKIKDRTLLSTRNAHAGTPAYMAPEQFEGRPVSEKVDVYAFAMTLYECLTGEQPWRDLQNPMQVRRGAGRTTPHLCLSYASYLRDGGGSRLT
eukprot:XP_001701972.1 mitogen activated protein kinase kinase kinase 8 [Chlamydomonas reinhardtii]